MESSLVVSYSLAEFCPERATYNTLNNGLSSCAQNSTVQFLKIAFHPPNPHCCFGKLPTQSTLLFWETSPLMYLQEAVLYPQKKEMIFWQSCTCTSIHGNQQIQIWTWILLKSTSVILHVHNGCKKKGHLWSLITFYIMICQFLYFECRLQTRVTARPQQAQYCSSLLIPYAWIFSPCIHNELLQCDVLKSTILQKHVQLIQ